MFVIGYSGFVKQASNANHSHTEHGHGWSATVLLT